MTTAKRMYTRAELTEHHDQFVQRHCVLCQAPATGINAIIHTETCVFADDSVTSIILIKSRPGVVLRLHKNRWHWTSPVSGREYCVEKLPRRYALMDEAGNEWVIRHKLSDIRHWIGLNQGRL